MKIYAVKDKLVGFGGPIIFKNEEIAIRWFKAVMDDKKSNHEDPKYYDLYELGNFNEETGQIIGLPITEIRLIAEGEVYESKD